LRQRARREDTLLVEDAIVGQLVLESQLPSSFCDECNRVVQAPSFPPGQRDDQSWSGGAFALECVEGVRRGFDQRRSKHEVLGRITDKRQLREDDKVGALSGGLIARASKNRKVAGDIAYGRIDLRDGYREAHLERNCDTRMRAASERRSPHDVLAVAELSFGY
jgi:hypothetical protein